MVSLRGIRARDVCSTQNGAARGSRNGRRDRATVPRCASTGPDAQGRTQVSEQLVLSHVDARRLCDWCGGPLRPRARIDTRTCSKACRQARHRFRVAPADATDRPLRFAYADPPYPKLARKYYRDHPDYGGEVDHHALINRLVEEFPDGWALST